MKRFLYFLPVITLLLFSCFLWAQNEPLGIHETLEQNTSIAEYISHVSPMAINPYLTVFMTSLCSKMGFHNNFIATNPFFDSWVVLTVFGILFLFTASVGTIFKATKVAAPIALADNWLSNKAAIVINAIIIIAPTYFSDEPSHQQIVYQAGFLSMSFKTLLIMVISTFFLLVVMTVRLFIDILIFLIPFPLIDSILEGVKIVITIGFVILSIISPFITIILSIIIFLISLYFYKRAKKMINKILQGLFSFFGFD